MGFSLMGCSSIPSSELPSHIQNTYKLGKILFTTETEVFEDTNLNYLDGTPKDKYVTFYEDAISISNYGGRFQKEVFIKVFKDKDIKEISFTVDKITEYYRPRFLVISWNTEKQVNQLLISDGEKYYAIRLTEDQFEQVKKIDVLKNIKKIDMRVVKRVKTMYDLQIENSVGDYIYIAPYKK